jgi:hypothetical protein
MLSQENLVAFVQQHDSEATPGEILKQLTSVFVEMEVENLEYA